ncbi:type VI secretion system-associated FHA domain protein TagH [Achromobacter seleniivolatilans]|uniref:Type VI secretion system-associated FHA domain protein TagH n=1 Tax=Achromobacter seleniivolatilans TaxID=3047478 RepID=A0ABY9M2M0_9BURK|nr:type VI secretion system-associated FHA domain protein TagH [Achromobacter sp. R39]WMD21239.1 type VI secretion system-associated FHA domain protein TagH [Achromobacter sp. R39]
MSTAPSPHRLALIVTNPETLQHGSTPQHNFDTAGGTIGTYADWKLMDKAGRVHPIHSEVRYEDLAFCVIDRSGKTRLNDDRAPLGEQVAARLSEGDVLHIGPYRIAVHLQDPHQDLLDPSRHLAQYGVDELLDGHGSGHDGLPADAYVLDREPGALPRNPGFHALSAPHEVLGESDPLRALDAAERAAPHEPVLMDPLDVRRGSTPLAPTQADLASTRFEAVTPLPQLPPGDVPMPKSKERTSSTPYRLNNRQAMAGDPTEASELLMQGLGVPLGPLDAQSGHALLLEAGQALGAAIQGIAQLYAGQAGHAQGRALLGRSLQPIEDNPLRLGQSYADTVQAMFSTGRSVVHLSPRAAVEESLTQLGVHQGAMIQAIESGLEAVLRSFAPPALLKRFQRYVSSQESQAGADDWAWKMYTHYYDELASARQRGFEKLFWEVFEQAYDRVLRTEAE